MSNSILDGFLCQQEKYAFKYPLLTGTLGGAAVGAIGGAIIPKKPEQSRLRRVIGGAAIGAGVGAATIGGKRLDEIRQNILAGHRKSMGGVEIRPVNRDVLNNFTNTTGVKYTEKQINQYKKQYGGYY